MRSILAIVCLFAGPALADPVCIPYKGTLALVDRYYGEVPTFAGITGTGALLTVTINPVTRDFTLWLQSGPDTICPLIGGDQWSSMLGRVQ